MPKPTYEDAQLLLQLYSLAGESELSKARHWFLTHYQPKPWEDLKEIYLKGSEEDRSIRMVIDYWDMVGALVNNGVLSEDLFFETHEEDIQVWSKVKVWVEGARRDMRPTYLRNLQILAERHLEWRQRNFSQLPHERLKKGR